MRFVVHSHFAKESARMVVLPGYFRSLRHNVWLATRLGSQATWVKELLSIVIEETTQVTTDLPPTLIIPLTASTRWASVDLSTEASWTLSGLSSAVVLPTRALQMPDRVKVALELAQRVARAHNRPGPQLNDIPPVVHSAVALVGGSPRLLSYLWEAIGERSGNRTDWHQGSTATLDPAAHI